MSTRQGDACLLPGKVLRRCVAAPDWLGTTSSALGGVVGVGRFVAALIVALVAVTVRTRRDVDQDPGRRRAVLQEG